MKYFSTTLVSWVILLASSAGAQTPTDDFATLSSRAQSLVDSDPQQAAALFKQALALQPSWPEGWFYMAGDLYRLNRYAESREAFHKGLELAPQNGPAWGFLGLCEFELGKYGTALADIGKSETLGLGSNHQFEAAVRQRAALILIRGEDYDQALSQLVPLSKFGDNSAPVITAVGLCAITIPQLPSELTSEQLPLVNLAGTALWANVSRRSSDAETAFRQLLATYPNAPGVHYAYGNYLMEIDQHAALAEFDKELQAHPSHWPTMLVAAFLQVREGQPESAIALAKRALTIAPEKHRWIAHAAIGHGYLSKGEAEKAIPELQAALQPQPDNASVHFYLEKAYRLAGRKEDAQREKAEFLRLKQQQDPLAIPGMIGPSGGTTGAGQ
jgi:tetratricopeptide (TPR) repeat protein